MGTMAIGMRILSAELMKLAAAQRAMIVVVLFFALDSLWV
jgi:hypothetical protein